MGGGRHNTDIYISAFRPPLPETEKESNLAYMFLLRIIPLARADLSASLAAC